MKNECDSIGKWISILYRYEQCYLGKELNDFKIGSGQSILLMALLKNNGISQEELSHFSKIDKATTAKAIKKLEEEGYVNRVIDPNDKRAYKVFLSDKALEIIPLLQNIISGWEKELTSGLTFIEQQQIKQLLKKMAGNACSCKSQQNEKTQIFQKWSRSNLKIDFSEININDKQTFDYYLHKYNSKGSEMTFTNFFMWRFHYNFRFSIINDMLCLIAMPPNGEPYAFIPFGENNTDRYRETLSALDDYFRGNNWKLVFNRIPSAYLEVIKQFAKTENDIILDRANSDYIYLTENLIHLKGKKYDGKRNHVNKFKKNYQYEYVPFNMEYIDECERIMDIWIKDRGVEAQNELLYEKKANLELLYNYDKLNCKGALIKVNGVFEAFTIGEKLNEDTAVIHIEKASSHINGLYPFINQQFCEHEWSNIKYINREQDLGIEGLRKAKLSYHPELLLDKYSLVIS